MSVHVLTAPTRLALFLYNYSLLKVLLLTITHNHTHSLSLLKHNISLILLQKIELKPNKTECTTNSINKNEWQWIDLDFFLSLGIPPVDSDYVIIQLRECCRAFKTLVNNPKSFPDVTFVVGAPPNEVKEIPAHKAILLARAPHLLKNIVCSLTSYLLSFYLFDFLYIFLCFFLFVNKILLFWFRLSSYLKNHCYFFLFMSTHWYLYSFRIESWKQNCVYQHLLQIDVGNFGISLFGYYWLSQQRTWPRFWIWIS
jgi:hypothetical protein